MSLGRQVVSDHQLARLLQIGVVLEEVVEARAGRHVEALAAGGDALGTDAGAVTGGEGEEADDAGRGADDVGDVDPAVHALLESAAAESADHRRRLEALVDELDAETVAYEQIEGLVREKYAANSPEDFDGVLYDQLCNEETAYKFYDDLIDAIEGSEAEFGVDRDRLLGTLRTIREEEAEGVEEVIEVMERVDASVEGSRSRATGGTGDGDLPVGTGPGGRAGDADREGRR